MLKGKLGCFIKVIFGIIGVMVIGLIFLQCTGGTLIKRIDNLPPTVDIAPWQIETPTHIYYAEKVTETKDAIVMSGWYCQQGSKWVKQKADFTLSKSVYYGDIKVTKRVLPPGKS